MRNFTPLIIAALASFPVLVSAQTQPTPTPFNPLLDAYQVRYQSNLSVSDGIVNTGPKPTTTPLPAAQLSVAPSVNAPTQALTTTAQSLGGPADTGTNTLNTQIEGSQVNQPPTGAGIGSTTSNKNIPIQGSQVNKQSTSTGPTTFTPSKNITIQGSQVNKQPTGTGTFTPSKNVTIKNSQFNNNASNATGGATQTTANSRLNSKRNITDVGQNDGVKHRNRKQQFQEAADDSQPTDRRGEGRKKQKPQHQRPGTDE